jgi:hypothetical protein
MEKGLPRINLLGIISRILSIYSVL